MKSSKFLTRIAGAAFALSMLLGMGVTAQAQYPYGQDRDRRDRDYQRDRDQRDRDYRDQRRRDDSRNGRSRDDYPNWGGSFDLRQTALNAGWNEGIKIGRNDRRRNRQYDFRDDSTYQRAIKDYSSRLGDRSLYQAYFRMAFEHGYSDGYRGY